MIYVVLGMHKSGTTLVSEILHKSGINMVADYQADQGYYQGNKIERQEAVAINHAMLNSRGINSLDIPVIPVKETTESHTTKMKDLVESSNNRYPEWGFKDPRTCITYPVWAEALGSHKLILVYRNPQEVMRHYKRSSGILKKWFKMYKSVLVWKQTNRLLIDIAKNSDRPLMLFSYAQLMQDDTTFRQLEDFTGMKLFDARKKRLVPKFNPTLWFRLIDTITPDKVEDIVEAFQELQNNHSTVHS